MSNPAPGALEVVRGFVNTFDAEDGSDELATPEQLQAWLAANGLEVESVSDAEHGRAVAARNALRGVLRAHHGQRGPEAAADGATIPATEAHARSGDGALAEVSERARLRLCFADDGTSTLEPAAGGVDGALGRLLTITHEADRRGEWTRLKICPAVDCQWAFYDRSRNRSATWCDMKICGNRHKVREYRERRLKRS